jgi:DNA gyrase subunit A
MLARASAEDYRPEGLAPEFGLKADGYRLSEAQAQAILELRLQRLTGLEQDKIREEYREVMAQITDLLDILAKPERITAIIGEELKKLKDDFADPRRTEIVTVAEDISIEDLIAPQDMVVTFSHGGYVKSQPLADYRAQRRGGRGRAATAMKEDDFIERLFVAHSHDYLLCFSSRGILYWLRVFEVPQGSRASRGKPIVNVFPLQEGEKITAVVPVKEFDERALRAHGHRARHGEEDAARGVLAPAPGRHHRGEPGGRRLPGGRVLTDGSADVMLFSSEGKAVRFAEAEVRPMGRQAAGVRGMRLPADGSQRVVCMLVARGREPRACSPPPRTATASARRSPSTPKHGRGGQGLIAIQASERNGRLVGAVLVDDSDQVMLISTGGVLIRMAVSQIREQGRSTQGVTLIALGEGEKLAGMERIEEKDEVAAGNGDGNGEGHGDEGERRRPTGDAPAPRCTDVARRTTSAPGRRCCRPRCSRAPATRCSTGTAAA